VNEEDLAHWGLVQKKERKNNKMHSFKQKEKIFKLIKGRCKIVSEHATKANGRTEA